MLGDADTRQLHEQGWLVLRGWAHEHPEATLSALASTLGEPVPSRPGGDAIDYLRPMNRSVARAASLSSQYEMGAFPLHTDTAHWPLPARYLLLCCLDPGVSDRGSLLLPISGLNMSDKDRAVLAAGVFLVRNGRNSWFSSILMSERPFVRYDPGCMSPATVLGAEAARLMEQRAADGRQIRIRWAVGTVLIVDNWQVLHGREAALDDVERVLMRMLVRSGEARRSHDRF